MSGRHVCQFRSDERQALVGELQQLIQTLNSTPQTQKYSADNPPDFLRGKIPRYKPNMDTIPLITHTAFTDVRPTADPALIETGKEDLKTLYVNIGGSENPYKTDWDNQANCDRQMARRSPSFGVGTMQLCCTPAGGCTLAPYSNYPC